MKRLSRADDRMRLQVVPVHPGKISPTNWSRNTNENQFDVFTIKTCPAMKSCTFTEGGLKAHPSTAGPFVAQEDLPLPVPLNVPVTVGLLDEDRVQLFELTQFKEEVSSGHFVFRLCWGTQYERP